MERKYRSDIVGQASELIGCPSIKYVREHPELGQSPIDGFDCSGFVRFVLTQAGLHIPDFIGQDNIQRLIRHTNEFWDKYGVYVHEELKDVGDLIFFSRLGSFPTHIGIVRDPESYIHSPGKANTKVKVSSIQQEPIKAIANKSRALYVVNPIGYKVPTIAIAEPGYRYHQRVV